MAERTSITLKGAKDLERVLKALPEKMAQRALFSGLNFASKPMLDEMKRLVHVRAGGAIKSFTGGKGRRPGLLKASLRRRRAKSSGGGKTTATIEVGSFGVFYAHLEEYGTKHSPAHPFIRPAFDKHARETIDRMGTQLGKRVEKEAEKLTGPLAKTGLVKRRRR